MFHLSFGASSIIFSVVIILHIIVPNLHFLECFLHMSLMVSISFSTLIALDKTISLALPFIYSTIVTHKSTMKISSITWILAGMVPTPVLMNIQTKTCRITILTLQSLCHLLPHLHLDSCSQTCQENTETSAICSSVNSETQFHLLSKRIHILQ